MESLKEKKMQKKTKSPYLESFEKSRRSKWANKCPNLLFLTQSRGNINEVRRYQTTEYHPDANIIAPPPSPTDAEAAPDFHPYVVARASALLDAVVAFASSAPLTVASPTVGRALVPSCVAPPSATSSAPAARESADDDDFPGLTHSVASFAPVAVAPATVDRVPVPVRAAPVSSSPATPATQTSTTVDALGDTLDILSQIDPSFPAIPTNFSSVSKTEPQCLECPICNIKFNCDKGLRQHILYHVGHLLP